MSESGANEAIGMEEFPRMPKNYTGFHVLPSIIILKLDHSSAITLRNTSSYPILYKIKCTSNRRISILDCAGILFPKHETVVLIYRHDCEVNATDQFLVLYTMVGMQWCIADANVLLCWQRAKAQQVPIKSVILTAKLKKPDES
uniref:Major sperm protein n=1 Tax=Setaria digitata TaxID=48799 RepID=A0A915PW03_9BILA